VCVLSGAVIYPDWHIHPQCWGENKNCTFVLGTYTHNRRIHEGLSRSTALETSEQ
jgi:hypothetical protein